MSTSVFAIWKPLKSTAPILISGLSSMRQRSLPMLLNVPKPTMALNSQTRWETSGKSRRRLFEKTPAQPGIRHKKIKPFTPRHNAATGNIMRNPMPATPSIPSMTLPNSLLFGRDNTTIFPFQMCSTSLTNLQFY